MFGEDRGSDWVCREEGWSCWISSSRWVTSFCDNSLSKIIIMYAPFFIDVKLQLKLYLKVFEAGRKFRFLVLIVK